MASEYTSVNAAQAIAKIVATDALEALLGNLVMGRLVNRNYESTLANGGDTVNVPIPPVMTPNNILEAGTVTNQNPSLGNAQVVLNQHAENTFVVPDVTRILVNPNLLTLLMEPAINGVVESIETSILNLYVNFTYNTATGSGSGAMDEARIDSAETTLFTSKVPQSSPRFLVVSGAQFGAMRQIARFTEYQMVGAQQQGAIMNSANLPGAGPMGANGSVKSALVFRSQFVAKPSSTTYNVMFVRDAIALVIRRLPQPIPGTGAIAEYAEKGDFGVRVVMSYQPNTLAQQFTVDVLYGCSVLRNSFGIQVLTN